MKVKKGIFKVTNPQHIFPIGSILANTIFNGPLSLVLIMNIPLLPISYAEITHCLDFSSSNLILHALPHPLKEEF